MELQLDNWQKEFIEHKGNKCLCSGRQVGKSTATAIDGGEYAAKNRNKSIMIIASTERQALLLFEKVLSHIHAQHKSKIIEKGKKKPTKHELNLKNGSVIRCLPVGESGYGIRGFTIDRLYADEAAFIPEEVWAAVTPMLATTGGSIILLSTPFGTEGYFYRSFHDKKFKAWHLSTEDVAEQRLEPQRTRMLEFLKDEKERMTKLQYQQEYMGLFVGGLMRFFPDELIKDTLTLSREKVGVGHSISEGDTFLGVDIARMGGDETVLVALEANEDGSMKQVFMEIPEGQRITATARLIIHKDKQHPHKKIYIDTGGMGLGVFDMLMEDSQTKRKTVSIDNSRRRIDKEKGAKNPRLRILLKEDLYNLTLKLMEEKKLRLFDEPEIEQSFRSIQYEYMQGGKLFIHGNYSHIVEAVIRACLGVKDKHLKLWASSYSYG